MEKDNLSDLRSLLEQKLNTFKDFLSATVLLKEAAVSEDVENIESLIEKRRSYIKVIDRIDCGIKKISGARMTLPSAETRKGIELLSTAIKNTAENAARLNGEFEIMLKSRHGDLRNRISEMSRNQAGIKGYAGGGQRKEQPRFLDIKL